MTFIWIFLGLTILFGIGSWIFLSRWMETQGYLCVMLAVFFAVCLIASGISYAQEQRDTKIMYNQLIETQAMLNTLINNGSNIDTMAKTISEYNSDIIRIQKDLSSWFGYSEYYNKDCDWSQLQLVEWR